MLRWQDTWNDSEPRNGTQHDASKLVSPEKEVFDIATPKLKLHAYGSDGYKQALAEMGEGLAHHYKHNRHHPEHGPDGINGMNLFDIVEMLMDWKAASERQKDGDIQKSIALQCDKFKIENQLYYILRNTVAAMGWNDE